MTEIVQFTPGKVFDSPDEVDRFREIFEQLRAGHVPPAYEGAWANRQGARLIIAWSSTALSDARGALEYVILTGIDVTESKRLERTILEISGREQRRTYFVATGSGTIRALRPGSR